MEKNTDQTYY